MVGMNPKSDAQLLREYAGHGAEGAFAEIVHRHTSLVYSAALRQVNSPDMAAEVAQTVFVDLARGAGALCPRLPEDASLAGWLCRSARNISLNLRRNEFRRHSRERLAMEQLGPNPETNPDWERLRPVVDEALGELSEPDYDALVMRFFKNQDLLSVGRALGVSDDAAQKRISRALEKLRDLLSRRGITTTAAALAVLLSANAVQTARPAGQKSHHGRRHPALAPAPGNVFDPHAVLRAVHPARRVEIVGDDSQNRLVLPAPLRQNVITGAGL